MSEINEAVEYFKKKPVYEKLFNEFKKKYESHGKIGGIAVLTGLSTGDKEDISSFLMKDFTSEEEVRVSAKLFEKALLKSRFSSLTILDIITHYFGIKLRTNKEKSEEDVGKRAEYLAELTGYADKAYIKEWLTGVFCTGADGAVVIARSYNADKNELKIILQKLIKAIPMLPYFQGGKKKELLAVFAAQTAGNPHFFDDNTLAGNLLTAFLRDYFRFGYEDDLLEAENRSKVLFKAGIIKDTLSNDVIAYGIRGRCVDGSLHQGMEGFLHQKEPVKLSLLTLANLEETFTNSVDRRVYIVENPAVFSILTSRFPEKAFICSYGQIRRAVFMLLDLFDKNTVFSYAGDFDPEGLLIAERLKKRYGERLIFWKYETDIYLKYMSEEKLTKQRIKKLDGVRDATLLKIAELMREEGRAAYQESMLEEYVNSPM
ncbi:TIGR02679 domain-containing protein [Catonella massiliensis]|uniref:DUF2399 domain-containing protein n=1 Tax=Catonella massiliensis TaxID=2799636 RepID=A0ABS1J3K5_9FIRM|nr:TIGR02679 domain-containing protein [Catonella massiliensis]MBK5898746.1 DUF2399 domain-containing protein [Catonella massiliensis]